MSSSSNKRRRGTIPKTIATLCAFATSQAKLTPRGLQLAPRNSARRVLRGVVTEAVGQYGIIAGLRPVNFDNNHLPFAEAHYTIGNLMNSSCAFPGAQVQFTYNENIERDDSRSCIADDVLITGYSPCAFTQWAKDGKSLGFDGKAAKKFAPSAHAESLHVFDVCRRVDAVDASPFAIV